MRLISAIIRVMCAVGFLATGLGPPLGILMAYLFYGQVRSDLRLALIPFACLIITWILPCLAVVYGIVGDRLWGWAGGVALTSIGLGVIIWAYVAQGSPMPVGTVPWLALLGIASLAGLLIKRVRVTVSVPPIAVSTPPAYAEPPTSPRREVEKPAAFIAPAEKSGPTKRSPLGVRELAGMLALLTFGMVILVGVVGGLLLRDSTDRATETALEGVAAAAQIGLGSQTTDIAATGQRLSTAEAQVQATLEADVPPFVGVSIMPVANYEMAHLVYPISGEHAFGGISFTLLSGSRAILQTQNHALPSLPTRASIEASVLHPVTVYVLVNGAYVYKFLAGSTAGRIVLSFANGTSVTHDLVVGGNLREHWGFDSGPTGSGNEEVITELASTADWMNVYSESQSRNNKPATAFIDMVIVHVPVSNQSSILTQIDIIDTSVDAFGMLSPSLLVYGITVSTTP